MNKYVSKKKLNLTWTGSLLKTIKNIYLTHLLKKLRKHKNLSLNLNFKTRYPYKTYKFGIWKNKSSTQRTDPFPMAADCLYQSH